jgi:polygalacturonase
MRLKNLLWLVAAMAYGQYAYSQTNSKAKYSWDNLPQVASPKFKQDTLNIIKFGAVADGITLNTKSINEAIVQSSKKGGGVVLVPAGLWLTGPIVMQSNVNLSVSKNATLLFTTDFDQYPLVKGNFEGVPSMRNQSPISGNNLVNVAITGSGIIDGDGDAWRRVHKDQLSEPEWNKKVKSGGLVADGGRTWYPSVKTLKGQQTPNPGAIVPGKTAKDYEDVKDFLRPNLVVFTQCKNVLLEGVTFQNSAAWALHPLMCENLTIRDVYVKNPDYAHNGDGLDIESCKNVLVEGSVFDVGDDGICIKSGKDKAGRERGMPTENVIIRNNVVYKGHGGVVIGSEMSGGAKNIFVSDCTFLGTDKGIRFKTTRGRGGVVENVHIRNIAMRNIVHEAIFFDKYYFVKSPAHGEKVVVPAVTEETPEFKDVYFDNIVCNGAEKGIFIRGLPEMKVKNIHMSNMILKSRLGSEIIDADSIYLTNVKLIVDKPNNNQNITVKDSQDVYVNAVKL